MNESGILVGVLVGAVGLLLLPIASGLLLGRGGEGGHEDVSHDALNFYVENIILWPVESFILFFKVSEFLSNIFTIVSSSVSNDFRFWL